MDAGIFLIATAVVAALAGVTTYAARGKRRPHRDRSGSDGGAGAYGGHHGDDGGRGDSWGDGGSDGGGSDGGGGGGGGD